MAVSGWHSLSTNWRVEPVNLRLDCRSTGREERSTRIMHRRIFLNLSVLLVAACGGVTSAPQDPPEAIAAPIEPAYGYFAGGCFWGVEHFLEAIPGVVDVESGYMGGDAAPTYEEVSTGATGHAETVRVTFDPGKVSYEVVAKRFFETQVGGQGPDIGDQYRSAVFVAGPEQRAVVDGLIVRLRANGYAVATEVLAAKRFWLAEAYHQDYYERTRKTPYCHAPMPRFDEPPSE